jgi:hypothetical protein
MSGRNFRRLSVRYEEDGVEGLRDRRVGKLSPRRAPTRELERMALSERSSDFTVKHFHAGRCRGCCSSRTARPKTQPTQVGRALSRLGITHIPSCSPQGCGRLERVFGTLQKRLRQELRLARIKTRGSRQPLRAERFVPDYNARFAVPAAEPRGGLRAPAGRSRTFCAFRRIGRSARQLRLLAPP